MSPCDFWEMDIAEINKFIEVKQNRETQELKLRAYFDHTLAKLVAYSFNSPKEMPSLAMAYSSIFEQEAEEEEWRVFKARFERYAAHKNQVMREGEKNGSDS